MNFEENFKKFYLKQDLKQTFKFLGLKILILKENPKTSLKTIYYSDI